MRKTSLLYLFILLLNFSGFAQTATKERQDSLRIALLGDVFRLHQFWVSVLSTDSLSQLPRRYYDFVSYNSTESSRSLEENFDSLIENNYHEMKPELFNRVIRNTLDRIGTQHKDSISQLESSSCNRLGLINYLLSSIYRNTEPKIAFEQIDKAIEKCRYVEEYYEQKYRLLISQKDILSSLKIIDLILSFTDVPAHYHYQKYLIFRIEKQHQEALNEISKVIDFSIELLNESQETNDIEGMAHQTKLMKYYVERSEIYKEMGRNREAKTDLKKANVMAVVLTAIVLYLPHCKCICVDFDLQKNPLCALLIQFYLFIMIVVTDMICYNLYYPANISFMGNYLFFAFSLSKKNLIKNDKRTSLFR